MHVNGNVHEVQIDLDRTTVHGFPLLFDSLYLHCELQTSMCLLCGQPSPCSALSMVTPVEQPLALASN